MYIPHSFNFSRHITLSIDDVVGSCLDVFQDTTHLVPKFKVHGGSNSENLALQNVQVSIYTCSCDWIYLYQNCIYLYNSSRGRYIHVVVFESIYIKTLSIYITLVGEDIYMYM